MQLWLQDGPMRCHRERGLDSVDDTGPPLLRDPLLYGVALIAALLCAPFFRYLTSLADEGVFLHAATRILGGETIYRDFFEFLPPGSFLIVAAWMKLVGVGFASVRVLAIAVLAAIAALLYIAARLSSGSRFVATLIALVWVATLRGELVVINHHWFTTAAAMASAVSLLAALQRAPRRGTFVIAGLFAGTAAMVTSTRGALVCFAILGTCLTQPAVRGPLVRAIAGIAFFPAVMILYLVSRGVVGMAIEDVIMSTARHYATIQFVPFGHSAGRSDSVAVAFFPVTFALAGATAAVTRGAIFRNSRFQASLALAVAGLLGTYPRPDIEHINFATPIAGPLLAFAVAELSGRVGRRTRVAVAVALIALCLAMRVGKVWNKTGDMMAAAASHTVPTARGPTQASPGLWNAAFANLVDEIARVPPGDAFFFYPYDPMLPYLTGRHHVADLDVLLTGYTTPEQFRETCRRVVSEAQWVVVDYLWLNADFLRFVFPAMRDANAPERRRFGRTIATAFNNVVVRSWRFELRHRAVSVPKTLCDASD